MKLLQVNIVTLMFRFYLMMAIVIASFFMGMPWLSILALPVFVISLLGITFDRKFMAARRQKNVKTTKLEPAH